MTSYNASRFASTQLSLASFGGVAGGAYNDTALALAIAALPSSGGTITAPPGKYYFLSNFAIAMPARPYSLRIVGDAQGGTTFYWPNAAGGMTFTANDLQNALHINDISITTGQSSGGTGISFINTTTYGGFVESCQSDFSRVTFQGDGGTTATSYWTKAVSITAIDYVNFYSCLFYGGVSAGAKVGTGIYLTNGAVTVIANYNIHGCSFLNLDYAVDVLNNPQGVCIGQSSLVDCNYGVHHSGGTALVGVQIENCNLNCIKYAVWLETEVDDFQFVGNTVYVRDVTGSFAGILLSVVARFTVSANNFYADGGATSSPAISVLNSQGWPGTISGNAISGPFAVGVNLGASTSLVVVSGNSFGSTVTTNIVNAGSSNTVDEVIAWTPVLKFGGGVIGITYAVQSASFIKTGQMATASLRITLTSKGSSTGAATITGFPTGCPSIASGTIGYYGNMSTATAITGYIAGSTFNFVIPGASGIAAATDTNFTNTSDFVISVTYPSTP